ncbi:hypothetical protein PGTUg99_031368 [Puccinia graminis f. sp. tritici]|uniref:Uncharacterized protein n=1 Tax=Puccinia graminis f. sp. tritici TaxID=56615 RepID=A0A5B0PJR0_PUCGR|nr:hypothetical protein PGTUg99_031368 [Puccinia graminis f. sp. tritici]
MAIAADFERVDEIGPVFRAENSNTYRHMRSSRPFESHPGSRSSSPMRVFTKVTLATHRGYPLRIASAHLELDEEPSASQSLLSISPACGKSTSIILYRLLAAGLKPASH